MAAIMLQAIPSFYTNLSEKLLFISAITYEKYIVCKDYCIAHHDDKTCFLSSCKYHILIHGNVEELLKKLDTFSFTYQHFNCLYTLFKYRFSGKVIAKSEQVFDNGQPAVDFNHRKKGVYRMPSIAKKRLLWKKFKKHLFSSFQKSKSTQTGGSAFAKWIEKAKKTKFELDLIKNVDCFSDGHGNHNSILVYLKKIFINEPFFEIQRDLYKSIVSANDIVITPIKNPIAMKNATTKKIVPHTRKKSFYRKPSSLSNKLVIGSTLIIIQRESEKTVWKADFQFKILERVRF